MEILSYLGTAFVLSSVYFNSKPKLRGQYLSVCASVTWITYGLFTSQWAILIQSMVILFMGLSAIRNWKKRGIEL